MSQRQSKNRAEGRRRSRTGGLITAGVLAGVVSVPALAGPSGEQVVHGEARFQRTGSTTTITTGNSAIINYDAFNLNASETVRFIQPGAASKVLNRIQGGAPSVLDGAIFANGNVYFVNPAGIFFGQNSVVNVGGIFAAAGNITNHDFLNNVNRFTDLSGDVVNHGQIIATKEAHLVGRRVANFGRVVAPDGMITMSAGKDVLLGQRGGKVFARISGDASANGAIGVENHGVIDAGSGQVIAGVGDHFALALYDTSVIRGNSVRVAGGASSVVKVSGAIDATNNAGAGGDIEVLGGRVALLGADLDASGTTGGGQINVGGDYQGIGDRLRSELTYVDAGSSLAVNATHSGDAGTAIIWSDGATIFRGDISGKGAAKGGFAEVSSRGHLDFKGTFDLRGSLVNGTLLLDPKDIIVTADDMGGANDIIDVDTFSVDSGATTFIHDDLLSAWLNGGVVGDVMLKANNDIVFGAFSSVTQNAGQTSSLNLFAGRRIAFGPNSSLVLGGGSLNAIANAIDEVGFVAADRDAGAGTIIFSLNSSVRVTNAGQSASFTVTDSGGTAGDIIVVGELVAPTISLSTTAAGREILVYEDGNGATSQFGLGSDVILNAGQRVRFFNNTGIWSFGSLDATASEIRFDANATGATATAGSLAFNGMGSLFTDNAGLFTFTGPVSLATGYQSAGDVLFANTLDLDGGITAPGSVTFQDAVTLGGDSSVTLTAAGNVLFNAAVIGTTNTQDDLTVNLGGFGDLTFNGVMGTIGTALGDITVNELSGTLTFNDFIFANSLTSTGGVGTVNLGNGTDLFIFLGDNGSGNALEIAATQTNLQGSIVAATSAVNISGPLAVMGHHSIGTSNANGTIDLGSVVLDASAADTSLTLDTFGGAVIRVAQGAGQSVQRDATTGNNADLYINSNGGDVFIGNVLSSTGTEDNILRIFDINAGMGTVDFTGGRYIANTMTFVGGAFDVSPDSNFGDLTGGAATNLVDTISFTGGELRLNGNDTLQLVANQMGGSITIDNAVALGADANLDLEANGMVTLGTIGDNMGGALNRVDLTAGDATLNGGIFAESLFLDPTGDVLNFGGGAGGMLIDAGEVANLSTGSIGTLFLGHDDRTTAGSYAGTTNLFGVPMIGDIEVFGATTVDGIFEATNGRLSLFGATTLLDGAGLMTSAVGEGIFFYDSLDVMSGTSLTTNNGSLSMVNLDPDGVGGPTGRASINGAGAGSHDLTINTGTGRATLFNVGSGTALTSLTVNANQLFMQGSTYNMDTGMLSANEYRVLGDISGAIPGMANFTGDTLTFADAAGLGDAFIRLGNGIDMTVNMTDAFTSNAALVGVPNFGNADQSVTINAGNQITFTDAIGWTGDGDVNAADLSRAMGSLTMNSDQIVLGSVLTSGDQTYAADVIDLRGERYQSLTASAITFIGDLTLNPPMGGGLFALTDIRTADGGSVAFDGASIAGNGNAISVNTGSGGVISFGAGMSVTDAAQTYLAGNYNFLGGATLSSTLPGAAITFQGGTLNLGGMLAANTAGPDAEISLGNAIALNGFDLNAVGIGAGSDVTVGMMTGTGTESVRLIANGQTIVNGIGGGGVSLLDIETNALSIDAMTMADMVNINTFDKLPALNISVGDDALLAPGTLNISNASLANLAPVAGGTNLLTIGDPIYDGQILIGGATINRDVAFLTGPMGLIDLAATGLNGTGGLTSIIMTAPEIRLGGAIQSDAGLFSLALNAPVNVSGNADIDTNGGDVLFGDSINGIADGTGFLDINTAGGTITMREDLGVIGADRALGQLSLIGAPTLRLVGANTAGDQFFQTTGGMITLLDGATFTALDEAVIAIASDTEALGDASATTGAGGTIAFQGLLDGTGNAAQTVTLMTGPGGQVNLAQVGGPAGLGSLAVTSGTIGLSGDLTLLQNLSLTAAQTLLNNNVTMSANSITLATDIDSTGEASSLTLEDAIDTLIQGRLGGNSPLATFTSSDVGTTTLTGGVFSNGQALFRNNVVIAGNAIVQTFGTGGNDGIRFLGTVDGSLAGADALTLIVDRSLGQLVTDPITGDPVPNASVPLIELFGNVGSNVALGTLGLNFGPDVNGIVVDGRGFVPANATIVLGDSDAFFANGTTTNILFNVDNLFMGAREKMVALGGFTANGINARLSDIATLTDLTVNYNAVTIFLREAGDVFDPTTGLVAQDTGTDFVAGGDIAFANVVALQGPGANPQFSLPGGDPTISSSAGFFLFKSLDTPITNLVSSGFTVLDVRADGPTNTNVSEALAGAVPQEQQAEPVVTDVALSQVALDALVDLGIVIKQPTENLYLVDLPDDIADASDTARVSRRRLEPTLVSTLVADYDTALKERVSTPAATDADPQTVSVIRRDTEIKAMLDTAWEAFTAEQGEDGDADAFFSYVSANTDRFGEAVVEIGRLREVVMSARVLGLTEREIGAVKTKMFTMMQPNMGPRAFRDLIEATPAALLGVR